MPSQLRHDVWCAIQVKPKHERTVARAIREKGYEELLPMYLCRRKWSDRDKDVEVPLFPGYVFCCFDSQVRLPLITTPGVRRVIGEVQAHEMTSLRRLVSSGQTAEPWPFIQTGTTVRLQAGPLAGVEGIVLGTEGSRRLIISVTLLQRSVAVEVDPRWVAPSFVLAGREICR